MGKSSQWDKNDNMLIKVIVQSERATNLYAPNSVVLK